MADINDMLSIWKCNDYEDLQAQDDSTRPTGSSWENFERINARFRCLKSRAYADGQLIDFSRIHNGAHI
ncbi:hypothetical protein BGX21_006656, partial [Mortierella sp. AD011]